MFLNCLINCYRPGICIYDSGVALKNWWALTCTKYRFFAVMLQLICKMSTLEFLHGGCQFWSFFIKTTTVCQGKLRSLYATVSSLSCCYAPVGTAVCQTHN